MNIINSAQKTACCMGNWRKSIKIYYMRPGALMFGILFPISMFLSYIDWRNIPVEQAIPMLVAQTLFFASIQRNHLIQIE